ncbi:hypothetical protein B0T25DRAFT_88447 [Lasiosphaeria hispida]|uniref:Uncharacterized protein n=1 Tax=Lasiosphaeria hispida TaxID=260671 RepID=A0AAJ0MHE9_9PEZI|nr:hypothetical protein B0T25DRAFT_88447 [Lasiosphaeria hispida]
MDLLPSCLGRWEELVVSQKLSNSFTMNWTEGQLHRTCHGRLRRANEARQRQKQFFARGPARAAEQKEFDKRPPSISFLRSGSSSSRRSRASHRSSSSPKHCSSHLLSAKRADHSKKRQNVAPTSEEQPLLPTISRFFAEKSADGASGGFPESQTQYDEQALERMRKRLLAKKDWGIARVPEPTSAALKRPRLLLQNENLAGDIRDIKRPTHLPKNVLDRKHEVRIRARTVHRDEVKIRFGSQEKRLGESSTINRPSATHSVTEMRDLSRNQLLLPRDSSGMSRSHTS